MCGNILRKTQIINILTEQLNRFPMLRQMRESMLRQRLHADAAQDSTFHYVLTNLISITLTNGLSKHQF